MQCAIILAFFLTLTTALLKCRGDAEEIDRTQYSNYIGLKCGDSLEFRLDGSDWATDKAVTLLADSAEIRLFIRKKRK